MATTGSWWQGTLDAFGVGFVVGGIVDVTAISLLNQILGGAGVVGDREDRMIATEFARSFLEGYGHVVDADAMAKRYPDKSKWMDELAAATNWYTIQVLRDGMT